MKKLLSILIVFVCLQLNAQDIITKDGVNLGLKSVIVDQCIEGGKGAMMEVDGIQIDFKKYCSCVIG
ncbi:MAG: hypothetical protein HRT57_12775 [Crocinitomicaceae bacterium]|nr:hypothetical protein [Crocinitomicaceae bacterium]